MTDYETKREAFETALDQLEKARARVKAINQELPDVLESDKRQALKDERAKLKTEIESLPDEIGELARLAALANLARMKAEGEEARAELAGLELERQTVQSEITAFLKRKDQGTRENPYFREGPGGTMEKAAEMAVEGGELDKRCVPLDRKIGMLDGKIKAFAAVVFQNYPGADPANPNTWARVAHDYGELWRKNAIG